MGVDRLAKKKLSKQEADDLIPVVKKFNGIAREFLKYLSARVEHKEQKISVMVSKIAKPEGDDHSVNVVNVGASKAFFDRQRKQKKKDKASGNPWNESFTEQRGFMI